MEIGKRSTDYACIWQMREIFAQHIRQFHVNNQYMPLKCLLQWHCLVKLPDFLSENTLWPKTHSCSELLIASNGLWQLFAVQFLKKG